MKALAPEKFEQGFGKVNKGKRMAAKNPTTKGAAAAVKKAQSPQGKRPSQLSKVI